MHLLINVMFIGMYISFIYVYIKMYISLKSIINESPQIFEDAVLMKKWFERRYSKEHKYVRNGTFLSMLKNASHF